MISRRLRVYLRVFRTCFLAKRFSPMRGSPGVSVCTVRSVLAHDSRLLVAVLRTSF